MKYVGENKKNRRETRQDTNKISNMSQNWTNKYKKQETNKK